MLAELRQHVVVERHAGLDVDDAGAVEVEFDQDVGLFGGALHSRASAHASTLSVAHVRRPHVAVTSSNASPECGHLGGGADADPKPIGAGPVSRIKTPRSSSACQTACRSSNRRTARSSRRNRRP